MCIAFSVMLSTPGRTTLAVNFVLLTSVLFAGFLANKESIVWPLRWVCYISPFRCDHVCSACTFVGCCRGL